METITEEQLAAAVAVLDKHSSTGYWDTEYSAALINLDGTFTIAELEAIILIKRHKAQEY